MKKLISLALSLALALALAVPGLAVGSATAAAPAKSSVGVILNDKSIAFTDAVPFVKDGRTMVPFRALMEAMGGKISVDDAGLVTCAVNGVTLSFTPGSAKIDVTAADGAASSITMDAPSYYSAGRTYVPVRFFAQAFGYDVLWDADARSAVLVDRASLVSKLDENFSTLNAVLAKSQNDPAKNYKSTATYNINISMKDDSGAAVSAALKLNLTMLSSAAAVEMEGTMDATALAKLMGLEDAVKSGSMTSAEAATLTQALSSVKFELICNLDADAIYLNMPILSILSGDASSANTWYKLSMGLDDLGLSSAALTGKTASGSVGALLYAFNSSLVASGSADAADLYSDTLAAGSALAAFLGNGSAVRSGASYQWKINVDAVNKLLAQEGEDGVSFKAFNVVLTGSDSGAVTITFDVQTAADDGDADEAISFSGTLNSTSTSAKLDMTMQMGSALKMVCQFLVNMAPTTESPALQPPAGASVTDWSSESEALPILPQ